MEISRVISDSFGFAFKNFVPLTLVYVALSVILFGPVIYLVYHLLPGLFTDPLAFLQSLDPLENAEASNPFNQGANFQVLNAIINLVQLVAWGIGSIFAVLIIRVITQGASPFVPRIDMNILRYIVGSLVAGIAAFVTILAIVLIVAILAVMASAVLPGDNKGIAIALLLGIPIGLCTFIYVIARASLIPVDMVAASKIRVPEGWNISKENGFNLFLTYFLAFVCVALVALVGFGIGIVTFVVGSGETISALANSPDLPDEEVLRILGQAFNTPVGWVAIAIMAVVNLYTTYAMKAVPVFAYVQLKELQERNHDSVVLTEG